MNRPSTSTPPDEAQATPGQPASMADAFAQVRKNWRELVTYFGFYLGVQIDRLLLSFKALLLVLAIGGLVMIGLGAMLVTAAVQILMGIAQLLTVAFGGRAWAGELVTGGIFWIVVLSITYAIVSSLIAKSRQATLEKYEQRRAAQRSDLGQDVEQKANE
jgi:hypothetical protein